MAVEIKCSGSLVRQPNTIIGHHPPGCTASILFKGDALIRSGTVIYAGCVFGSEFQTGHNVLVRENSIFGQNVLLGSGSIVDGKVRLGDFIKIESNCYIAKRLNLDYI